MKLTWKIVLKGMLRLALIVLGCVLAAGVAYLILIKDAVCHAPKVPRIMGKPMTAFDPKRTLRQEQNMATRRI